MILQLGSERRHRLHGFEVPEVIKALRLLLLEYVEEREDLGQAEIAFRPYFRLTTHKPGRPSYPDNITWQAIEEYVNGTIFSSDVEETPYNE